MRDSYRRLADGDTLRVIRLLAEQFDFPFVGSKKIGRIHLTTLLKLEVRKRI